MSTNLLLLVLTGALVGAASGYLGSFMVLKRMSLVGDALSHVALPGMAIAISLGVNPMLGAFVALTLAIISIWFFAEKSEIYPEALVGVFFMVSLAIGILITPEPELFEVLFGSLEKIGIADGIFTIIGAVVIFLVTAMIADKLLLGIVSEDLAKSGGVKVNIINLIYLLMVGLAVALGVKFVGTLLTGALVIIPAVAAKNFARNIREFHWSTVLIGIFSSVLGIMMSRVFGVASGPAVVLVSVGVFIISYLVRAR